MAYLYALLGISMITSIMTIIQISSSITSQREFSVPKSDEYLDSESQNSDRLFLKLLKQGDGSWGYGNDICDNLLSYSKQMGDSYKSLDNYQSGVDTISDKERFIGSCAITNGVHRILVTPYDKTEKFFGLYSCLLEGKVFCQIESNPNK